MEKNNKLTVKMICIATAITREELESYLDGVGSISVDDEAYLHGLTCMFEYGINLESPHNRIAMIIDTLMTYYEMNYQTISSCIDTSEEIIKSIHMKSHNCDHEMLYDIAIKIMMIYYVLKYPDYEKMKGQRKMHGLD